MGKTLPQCTANCIVGAKTGSCGENQSVEIELGAGALVVAIALQDGMRLVDQRCEGMASGALHKHGPGIAAGNVVCLGRIVQPIAVRLGKTGLLGCGGPFSFLAVGDRKSTRLNSSP